jgi:hypothetical protein
MTKARAKVFRGIIKNEKGEVIFNRRILSKNKKGVLSILNNRVCVDIPDDKSLIYNMVYGGDFQNSPYNLKRYYKDITKLKFIVKQI